MFTEKIFAVVDTETLGGAAQSYCNAYHVAAIALSRKEFKSSINILVIKNMDLTSAHYGKMKKEYYRNLLKNPDVIVCFTEAEAQEVFKNWLNENQVSCVCAFNSEFDFNRTLVKDCVNGMEFFDIMFAFFDTIAKTKRYKNFCAENGYYTEKKNCKMTAEICFRYLSGDNDFIEEHTALSDCEIEAEILRACWNTHKKFTRNIHKAEKRYLTIHCPV